MEIVNSPELLWSSDDEANWNTFLRTTSGSRLISKMLERAPTLLGKGDTNEILIRNGELRGFQQAVVALMELTHAAPVVTELPPEYPPLDDHSKWPKPTVDEFTIVPKPEPETTPEPQ